MSYELVLDALGDATRRGLVDRLRDGPLPVGELAAPLPISRPAVSKHLKVLSAAGLVTHEVDGTRRVSRLDPRGLDELRRWTEEFWAGALEGFASHVDRRTRPTRERKPR